MVEAMLAVLVALFVSLAGFACTAIMMKKGDTNKINTTLDHYRLDDLRDYSNQFLALLNAIEGDNIKNEHRAKLDKFKFEILSRVNPINGTMYDRFIKLMVDTDDYASINVKVLQKAFALMFKAEEEKSRRNNEAIVGGKSKAVSILGTLFIIFLLVPMYFVGLHFLHRYIQDPKFLYPGLFFGTIVVLVIICLWIGYLVVNSKKNKRLKDCTRSVLYEQSRLVAEYYASQEDVQSKNASKFADDINKMMLNRKDFSKYAPASKRDVKKVTTLANALLDEMIKARK